LVGDQGKTISNLQSQLRAAKFARDEAMAATKRMENRLKKAEARTKELENMEVSFG
jgi:phage shock protein A